MSAVYLPVDQHTCQLNKRTCQLNKRTCQLNKRTCQLTNIPCNFQRGNFQRIFRLFFSIAVDTGLLRLNVGVILARFQANSTCPWCGAKVHPGWRRSNHDRVRAGEWLQDWVWQLCGKGFTSSELPMKQHRTK